MAVRVSPTEKQPTHHFSLATPQGVIGFNAVDKEGNPNIEAIRRVPFNRSTLRTQQGGGQFAEQRPPYGEFSRATWIGGIGAEEAESDATKFWHGRNVWSAADGRLMLAPKMMGSTTGTITNTGAAGSSITLHDTEIYIYYIQWYVTLSAKTAESVAVTAQGTGWLTLQIFEYTDTDPFLKAGKQLGEYRQYIANGSPATVTFNTAFTGTAWIRLRGDNIIISTTTTVSTYNPMYYRYIIGGNRPTADSEATDYTIDGTSEGFFEIHSGYGVETTTHGFVFFTASGTPGPYSMSGVFKFYASVQHNGIRYAPYDRRLIVRMYYINPTTQARTLVYDATVDVDEVMREYTLRGAGIPVPESTPGNYIVIITPYYGYASSSTETIPYGANNSYRMRSLVSVNSYATETGIADISGAKSTNSRSEYSVLDYFIGGEVGVDALPPTLSVAPTFTITTSDATIGATNGKYFEYRHSLYFVSKPAGNAQSTLYLNCDRGACDSNTGALTKLNDATKNWTTNEWAGCVAKVIEGPGAGEWRKITSNTQTQLTVSVAWSTEHTTLSSYVIKGRNKFTAIAQDGTYPLGNVKDVINNNYNVLHFCHGSNQTTAPVDLAVRKMREYNNAGTWTREWNAESVTYADLLAFGWDQKDGSVMWRVQNTVPPTISRAICQDWAAFNKLTWGANVNIGDDQPIRGIVMYDAKVAVSKANSVWLVNRDNLPEKASIDMTSQYDETTGVNPSVFSPYLVFPYANGLERLYGSIVEEVAPAMPMLYSGQFVDSFAIPGALIAARRGVNITGSGAQNSTVMIYRNGAWHPLHSLDGVSKIYDIYYQRIDSGEDVVWIASDGGGIGIRFPREWDYLKDPNFAGDGTIDVIPVGYAVTGWFNQGNKRISKWWESIYIQLDQFGTTSTTAGYVEVYYQTERYLSDDDLSDWTYAGRLFESGELDVQVESKEIRYLFKLSGDSTVAPVMYGYNITYLARVETANSYTIPIKIRDAGTDLQGAADVQTAYNIMAAFDEAARQIEPMLMRSVFNLFDNKRVLIDKAGLQAVDINADTQSSGYAKREEYYGTLIVYEAD